MKSHYDLEVNAQETNGLLAKAEYEACVIKDFDINGKIESLSSALSSEFPPLYIKVASISGNYIGYISWMIQYSTWDAKWYI